MMHRLGALIEHHGVTTLALVAGLAIALRLLLRRPAGSRPASSFVVAAILALFALGGYALPEEPATWVAGIGGVLLFLAALVVLISGNWSYYVGLLLGAGIALGLGGMIAQPLSEGVYQSLKTI